MPEKLQADYQVSSKNKPIKSDRIPILSYRIAYILLVIIVFTILPITNCFAVSSSKRSLEIVDKNLKTLNEHPPYDTKRAVIIGINNYHKAPPLQYAVNDAKAVKKSLLEFGFDENNIIDLYDESASKRNILSTLSVVLPKIAKKEDCVFIFFAGHGQTVEISPDEKIGYLVPVDGDFSDPKATCISMSLLQLFSKTIPAKHIYFVIDACYSGYALQRSLSISPEIKNYVNKITTLEARQILTAGGSKEQVVEFGGHGLFTEKFLFALEGAGDVNSDGIITASELGYYIKEKVSIASENNQTPVFGSFEGEGDFVFIKSNMDPKQYDKILSQKKNIEAFETYYQSAIIALNKKEYGKAKNLLLTSLKYDPNNIWANEKLSFIKSRTIYKKQIVDQTGKIMVLIPGGNFIMGSDDSYPDERPLRKMYLDSFYIDQTEVTNHEYKIFMDIVNTPELQKYSHPNAPKEMDYTPYSWTKQPIPKADEPVTGINWYAAWAYANWAQKRLPMEAEWEKAARGIDGRRYPWGNAWKNDATNWFGKFTPPKIVGTNSHFDDVSPYNVFFMSGNVREWISKPDKYYYRKDIPMDNSGILFKPIRGGSFKTKTPKRMFVTGRSFLHPSTQSISTGFRCVKDVKAPLKRKQ